MRPIRVLYHRAPVLTRTIYYNHRSHLGCTYTHRTMHFCHRSRINSAPKPRMSNWGRVLWIKTVQNSRHHCHYVISRDVLSQHQPLPTVSMARISLISHRPVLRRKAKPHQTSIIKVIIMKKPAVKMHQAHHRHRRPQIKSKNVAKPKLKLIQIQRLVPSCSFKWNGNMIGKI